MKHSGLDNINKPAYDAVMSEVGNKITAKFKVTNITTLTNNQLDSLKAGDIVTKKTGNALHSYIVSYKGEGAGTGICLTYTDAGYIETVSYDRSGNGWVYNSTDVCDLIQGINTRIENISRIVYNQFNDFSNKINAEYNETSEQTIVTFIDCLPVELIGQNYTYILANNKILDLSNNTEIGTLVRSGTRYRMTISGNQLSKFTTLLKGMLYIPYQYKSGKDLPLNFDFRALINPQPAGTKLYKHTFTLNNGVNDVDLVVIDNRSSAYDIPSDITNQPLSKYLSVYLDNKIVISMSGSTISYLDGSGVVTSFTISSFDEDIVTSL